MDYCRNRKKTLNVLCLSLLGVFFAPEAAAMVKLPDLPFLFLGQEQAKCVAGVFSLIVDKVSSHAFYTLDENTLKNKFGAQLQPKAKEYAQKCFEHMSQLAQNGKINWLKKEQAQERDKKVKLSVYSMPFPFSRVGVVGLCKERKVGEEYTDQHVIRINSSLWNREQKGKDDLSDAVKLVICHETAHAWLRHTNNCRTTSNQVEFEAESLTAMTLQSLQERGALLSDFNPQYIAFSFLLDQYLLGCVNGMSHVQDDQGELRALALNTAQQKKTLKLGYEAQQDLVAMIPGWQPKELYEDAVQQKNELLGPWRPGRILNLNNCLRAPFFVGGAYWLYKNRDWVGQRPWWQLVGSLGLAYVVTKPITTYQWIVGLPQKLKMLGLAFGGESFVNRLYRREKVIINSDGDVNDVINPVRPVDNYLNNECWVYVQEKTSRLQKNDFLSGPVLQKKVLYNENERYPSIFLHDDFYQEEQKYATTASPSLRMKHVLRRGAQHKNDQEITFENEFKAEENVVQTLAQRNEYDVISHDCRDLSSSFYHLNDARFYGLLNGISKLKDENKKKDVIDNLLKHEKKNRTFGIGLASELEKQTLIEHWTCVDGYQNAVKQSKTILKTHHPLSKKILNVNNLVRGVTVGLVGYTAYKCIKIKESH